MNSDVFDAFLDKYGTPTGDENLIKKIRRDIKENDFVIPGDFLKEVEKKNLKVPQVFVLCYIHVACKVQKNRGKGIYCSISNGDLCKLMAFKSPRHVQQIIHDLAEKGFLEVFVRVEQKFYSQRVIKILK